MSNLKHLTEEQLRREVLSLSTARAGLLADAQWLEAEAARLQEAAGVKRHKYHNLGQREAWARLYLAQKAGFKENDHAPL